MNAIADIAAIAICTVLLAVSAWLHRKVESHLADARRHLAEARAIFEREGPPPRWLHVVDGNGPK